MHKFSMEAVTYMIYLTTALVFFFPPATALGLCFSLLVHQFTRQADAVWRNQPDGAAESIMERLKGLVCR